MGPFFTTSSGPAEAEAWLVKQARLLCSLVTLLLLFMVEERPVHAGVGVNWGTQASHKLPASLVVQMLKDNNFTKVKLFDSDAETLRALAGTDIEVMVAIPNNLLQDMTDSSTASAWVEKNVKPYIFQGGVNIKYVAVGNEPFLTSYNGSFVDLTFPALQNIQNALNNDNLGNQIKTTVPMNADVLSNANLPSQGTFRHDTAQQMTQIVDFLHQNNCPFTINIYPFISLADNANFPFNYAFFDSTVVQVQDGTNAYTNTFDASYDTLVAALTIAGYPSVPIIVGEIGWPTDGLSAATPQNAQRFNQGFLNHVKGNAGTPSRPNTAIDYYLFSLLDEDQKSIAPGNFERHWGIFAYDGTAKYSLTVPDSAANANGNSNGSLVNAKGVEYLPQRWCVLADNADLLSLQEPVTYACTNSDCTELGYGCSCNNILDARGNASYAFNQFFQMNNQGAETCNFDGLASITDTDPSNGTCKFIVQIAVNAAGTVTTVAGALISNFTYLFLLL